MELDGEFHVADVLGKLVDGVDEGPAVELGAEGVDGALLGESRWVKVGEDFSGDGAGLGDYVGEGASGAPETEVTIGVDGGDELGVPLAAHVVAGEALLDPPADDAAHVGAEGDYGVGVGVERLPV